ncbi:hypothetical protein [Neisseria meningitidis]|uniref:hypothetical protein n=1 Tax=Neisseria meningitidis TaxID=487 RepID=UPI000A8EDBD9|nr:hypothetical protein [Neisseria meningitidis]
MDFEISVADAKPAPAAGYAETVSDGICIGIIKSGQGDEAADSRARRGNVVPV